MNCWYINYSRFSKSYIEMGNVVRQKNKAVYKEEQVDIAARVMQVWVNQHEQWHLASIQFSPVAKD